MKIVFVGDIMLGRLISDKYNHQPYQLVSDRVIYDIKKGDLVIANLESPIIKSDLEVKDHMCFCGRPHFLKQFQWVNLFSIANNHINDFGDTGIRETIENLEQEGFSYNGIYRNNYKPYLIENEKIAIITLTDLMNHEINKDSEYHLLRMDSPLVINLIREYKESGWFVILFAHVGMLFTRFPNPITYDYIHKYIEAGAGLVVTSHSHCMGGVEYYKGVPIVHSLGDFLMDGASFRRRQASYLEVNIDNQEITCLELHPVVTKLDLTVDFPSIEEESKILKSINKVSKLIEKHEADYESFYRKQYNKEIMSHSLSTLHFLYKTKGLLGLIKIILRRFEDVKHILKWSIVDRSKVQSDTEALEIKNTMTEKEYIEMGGGSLVSIITPCYNSEKYIGEMIRSVLKQTYTNWELLITDDCSTDNSREIVMEYATKDSRVKLFQLAQNSGAGIARNNSIKNARGRYIAFLDSDDLWKPEKLERQILFIEKNGYKFVFCQAIVIDTDDNIVGFNKRKPRVSYASTKIINYIGTSGVMYDTEGIGKFYMKPIRRRQDWVLWMDILKVTRYAYCQQEPLGIVRTNNSESLSGNKRKLPAYHIEVYNKYLGYPKPLAWVFFYFISLPCFIVKKMRYKYEYKKFCENLKTKQWKDIKLNI